MLEIGNVFGFDNELKTLVHIFKSADRIRKNLLIERILENYDELEEKIFTAKNLNELNTTEISLIVDKMFTTDCDVFHLLSFIDNNKDRYNFLYKCNSSLIRNKGQLSSKDLSLITDFMYYNTNQNRIRHIVRDFNLDFIFEYIKINTILRDNFLTSKLGKKVMTKRLKNKLTPNEFGNLVKMYMINTDNEGVKYIEDLLRKQGLYDKFRKMILKFSI